MSSCSKWVGWVAVLGLLTGACTDAGAQPEDDWTGPGTVFAGHGAAFEAAGSAAPEPTMPAPEPEPQPAVDAGSPDAAQPDAVEPSAVEPTPTPVATAGSPAPAMGAAGSGAAGQAAPPVMEVAGSPAPPPRTEVALCTVAVGSLNFAPFEATDSMTFSAGMGVAKPALRVPYGCQGYVMGRATLHSNASTATATTAVTSDPDCVSTQEAIHAQQSVSVSWSVSDPGRYQTTVSSSQISPCTLAAGDAITSFRMTATVSGTPSGAQGKYVFEVRGYKAQ